MLKKKIAKKWDCSLKKFLPNCAGGMWIGKKCWDWQMFISCQFVSFMTWMPWQCYFQRWPTLELLYLQLSKQSWKCFEFVIMFEQEKANRSSFSHENHITKSGQKFLKLWGAQCWIVYVLAFKILIV